MVIMKKNLLSAVLFMETATVFFSGCENSVDQMGPANAENDVLLTATMEQPVASSNTKTSLSNDRKVNWESGDKIKIFSNTNYANATVMVTNSTGELAELTKESGVDLVTSNDFYSFYPSTDALSIDASGVITANFGEQTYVAGSFRAGASPMIAYNAANTIGLHFKNNFGLLKLSITGDKSISSIRVISQTGEYLSRRATINYNSGEPTGNHSEQRDKYERHFRPLYCPCKSHYH